MDTSYLCSLHCRTCLPIPAFTCHFIGLPACMPGDATWGNTLTTTIIPGVRGHLHWDLSACLTACLPTNTADWPACLPATHHHLSGIPPACLGPPASRGPQDKTPPATCLQFSGLTTTCSLPACYLHPSSLHCLSAEFPPEEDSGLPVPAILPTCLRPLCKLFSFTCTATT